VVVRAAYSVTGCPEEAGELAQATVITRGSSRTGRPAARTPDRERMRESRSSSAAPRASSPSHAARLSMNASSVLGCSKLCAASQWRLSLRPRLAVVHAAVAQQQLRDAVAAAHQVHSDLLARPCVVGGVVSAGNGSTPARQRHSISVRPGTIRTWPSCCGAARTWRQTKTDQSRGTTSLLARSLSADV
jgi:hypothetical protein